MKAPARQTRAVFFGGSDKRWSKDSRTSSPYENILLRSDLANLADISEPQLTDLERKEA